jgi:Alkylmercury lyase
MPPDAGSPERLHYLIVRHIIDTGHAPGLARLAELAELTPAGTEGALRKLEQIHGVILAPNSLRIWSVHPFALNPTTFWVSNAAGGWWANCAWCSLGIGAALKQDVTISTSDAGEGDALEFTIERGKASRTDLLMNFPYPPEQWWDNPLAPCVNILFHSSEARIDSWRARHGHPQGSFLPMEAAIQLAELWFGDYATPDWVRKTAERANHIFGELGLDRSFWKLPSSFR